MGEKGREKASETEKREKKRDLKSNAYTSHIARISARNMRYADRKLIIFLMQHRMFYTYILYI